MDNLVPETFVKSFNENGYALIENVIPEEWIDELIVEIKRLVNEFDPINKEQNDLIFSPGENQTTTEYFLSSSDKIRYFLEKDAWNPLTKQLTVPKQFSLNKIGHALHWYNPIFRRFTFNQRFQSIAKSIGLIHPVVVQSMIIFKNAQYGSEVPEHQDATYLYTTPHPKVVGFWIPLEDATIENGCLQFIPGSHRTHSLNKRWIRQEESDGTIQMKFVDWPITNDSKILDNNKSKKEEEKKFKSLPARKGSCVLIDGLVVHRSDKNNCLNQSRIAYTFHVFDQEYFDDNELKPDSSHTTATNAAVANNLDTNNNNNLQYFSNNSATTAATNSNRIVCKREWDLLNWLQPTDRYSFPSLYSSPSSS